MKSDTYIPGTEHLSTAVHSIWQTEGDTRFEKEYIIPQGVVEIIFNFSSNHSIPAKLGQKQHSLSRCFINGFNTAPVVIDLPNYHHFFGVRLQPLAAKKILGTPGGEFLDRPIDLTLIDPSLNVLWHQLAETISFSKRVELFTRWIEKRIVEWLPQEKLMNHFLTSVDHHDMSVTSLAGSLYYSPRHLSRRLVEATGMNTEELLLYKKYLHSVHLIHHTKSSLTDIAYSSNFSDQSHFIRTFKAYTKMTPGEYKRNKTFLKGHLYENVR